MLEFAVTNYTDLFAIIYLYFITVVSYVAIKVILYQLFWYSQYIFAGYQYCCVPEIYIIILKLCENLHFLLAKPPLILKLNVLNMKSQFRTADLGIFYVFVKNVPTWELAPSFVLSYIEKKLSRRRHTPFIIGISNSTACGVLHAIRWAIERLSGEWMTEAIASTTKSRQQTRSECMRHACNTQGNLVRSSTVSRS